MKLRLTALLCGVLFSSCSLYKEVEMKEVTEVVFTSMTDTGMDLDVLMLIYNPNGYTVTLTESDIDLYLEGNKIGTVELLEPMAIPRRSESVQRMKIRTSYGSLDQLIGNAFVLLFKQEFELEGRGYVTGKALLIRRKVDVNFKETIPREDLGF